MSSTSGDAAATHPAASEQGASAIPMTISAFCSGIRAISECAAEHIALANTNHERFLAEIRALSEANGDGTARLPCKNRKELTAVVDRITLGPHSDILAQSLLIFGFSTFDAYLGNLLKRLYREVPSLIYEVEDKEIRVAELLHCTRLDEAIDKIIDRDVSRLLRASYDQQFSILANRHGLSTLKQFDTWPDFIEAAQRRNLLTHCKGVVNEEYLKACAAAKYSLNDGVCVGVRLAVDDSYLRDTLDLLYEVGVMLGYTLWRKADPDRTEESELALSEEIYDLLVREQWRLARTLGRFSLDLPKPKRDMYVRICRVNYAQALKWSGNNAGAMKVLDAVDWSSTIRDLRLGVEALREHYEAAAVLMKEIGKKGELVRQVGYHEWPVFRQFRETEEFRAAYLEVFGTPFTGANEQEPPIEKTMGRHCHAMPSRITLAAREKNLCRRNRQPIPKLHANRTERPRRPVPSRFIRAFSLYSRPTRAKPWSAVLGERAASWRRSRLIICRRGLRLRGTGS